MTRLLIPAAAVALVASFLLGRWSSKPETIEKTRTVEVVKTKIDTQVKEVRVADVQVRERVVTRWERRPDGTVVGTSEVTKGTDTHENTAVSTDKHEDKTVDRIVEKERLVVRNERDTWHVGVLAGRDSLGWTPNIYGVTVSRNVLGPFTLGVVATTAREGFVTVGVSW